ncbi:MAG TPA: hypothetical protein PK566_19080 [Pseudobacteroides sp.]|nr:hypothetical protein [Pseudobacteroides sp.]
MVILVVLFYISLAVYEFVPLYKQKQWKDFWVNTVFWTVSFAMALLITLDVKVPSPAHPIRDAITSLFGE